MLGSMTYAKHIFPSVLMFQGVKDGKILKEWVSQNWVNLHLPNVSTWPEIGVLVPYQIKLWELNNLNKYTLP